MPLTRWQEHVLLHMTGLDRAAETNRSHFATDETTGDWPILQSLVALGLVKPPVKNESIYRDLSFFYVTEAGLAEAKRLAAQRS